MPKPRAVYWIDYQRGPAWPADKAAPQQALYDHQIYLERLMQDAIEFLGRGKVVAKGFLDDHARAGRAFRPGQLLDDLAEEHRRNGEVMRWMLRRAEFTTNRLKRRGVVVVAIDIMHQPAEFLERGGIERAVLLNAVPGPGLR